MKNRIYAICGVVFLFPVLALSQQPNPAAAAPAQQAPVLNPRPAYAPAPNAGEGRFHLDVQVTDKQGKPVTGLELQDFTLLDDGRPAKILSFHAIDAAAQGTGPATDVVLLIDAVDVDFQTVSRTRDEIERFLRQNDGRLAHPPSPEPPLPAQITGYLICVGPAVRAARPRTCSVKHLEENVGAAAFKLTDDEFDELAAGVPKPCWLRR